MTGFLGLNLERALCENRERGLPEPEIRHISPERHPEGTERVIRVREGVWTVARFPDRVKL